MTTARPRLHISPPSVLVDGDPRPRLFSDREYQAMVDAGIVTADELAELWDVKWRRFTNAEYHAMDDAGVFAPDERVQLIAGEIVTMSPMGSRHAAAVNWTTGAFYASERLTGRAIVWVQCPLVIPDFSEPEPDLALLRPRDDGYARAHPRPEDVLLLVEVADSTLAYDRRVKLPLYAAAGIPESWLMDLRNDVIESHTDPALDRYRTVRRYRPGDFIAPAALAELSVPVSQIIPARE